MGMGASDFYEAKNNFSKTLSKPAMYFILDAISKPTYFSLYFNDL